MCLMRRQRIMLIFIHGGDMDVDGDVGTTHTVGRRVSTRRADLHSPWDSAVLAMRATNARSGRPIHRPERISRYRRFSRGCSLQQKAASLCAWSGKPCQRGTSGKSSQ